MEGELRAVLLKSEPHLRARRAPVLAASVRLDYFMAAWRDLLLR